MLAQRVEAVAAFTRRDAVRLGISSVVLVIVLTAILAIDLVPQPLRVEVGDIAATDIVAPRAIDYESDLLTEAAREDARAGVPPQYDFTFENAIAVAEDQVEAFERDARTIDRAVDPETPVEDRPALIDVAAPDLSDEARTTMLALPLDRWAAVRAEGLRVLEAVERTEVRDSQLAQRKGQLVGLMSPGLTAAERMLAAELIEPFVVPNSSYSDELTKDEEDRLAAGVEPVRVQLSQNEVIVRRGDPITAVHLEAIEQFGLTDARPDVARLAGWLMVSILVVGTLLAWVWRFRRELWHRNNALLLLGLILVGTAFLLKATAGRAALPFILPTAAAGILVTILLDAGLATVLMIVLALLGGVVNGGNSGSIELATYILFGGLAGIIAIRRGDRLQVFVQAALAVAVVNALVVSTFGLLGAHDLRGLVELWGASLASAVGGAVAAVGLFAVLGNLFGILTVFQLLELANPSQPLLRRLLVETPGTYHHSLMVGNLAERAAEAIGADPLLTRVAAYYHDVGKLANPLAFIENQGGGENIHDELDPETSAQILRQHVPDGIDIAYKAKLPKSLIAFIPQHHGTAPLSYFVARARELAAAPFGGLRTAEGEKAAAAVDERKFRHAGPKPQSREAALLMLADGVEASVRSLSSRDESAIRAMVARIIDERMSDGQFEDCDLTLRDIERIKDAFVQQLLGMYHQRIAYPQNKVVEIESRRGTGTGA